VQALLNAQTSAALLRSFAAKAEAMGASVHNVADEDTAWALLVGVVSEPACTRSVVERFPRVSENCAATTGAGQTAPDVVAAGVIAIAETGSLLLHESRVDRGACYLADRLWLLVRADQLVPTLDSALERVADLVRGGARYLTLMSGPSRTADIERVLTIGVHGPRQLTLIVVGEATG
jgi:L-lactate dehydrogenase complex protein LldG